MSQNRMNSKLNFRGYINIFVGIIITLFAIVLLFADQLHIDVPVANRWLLVFYSAIALLYGPFRIWRGIRDLKGIK